MSQTDWVPTEVPADHWSLKPEYLAQQAATPRAIGTITPGTRTISTHELQMKACQVEWVDPNPKTEEQKAAEEAAVMSDIAKLKRQHNAYLDQIVEEMAADMIRKVNEAVGAPVIDA